MVAVTGLEPVFTPLKAVMFPFPEAASPMVASSFVQLKVVPALGLTKVMATVVGPVAHGLVSYGIHRGGWVHRNGECFRWRLYNRWR